MKKFMSLVLALMLVGLPVLAQTQAEEAPLIEDAAYREQVAADAYPLLQIMAKAMDQLPGFTGAPDAQTAWLAISEYAHATAAEDAAFTEGELEGLYTDLFAEGSFGDIAQHDQPYFTAVDGGYAFASDASEAEYDVARTGASDYTDEKVIVNLSQWFTVRNGYPQNFAGNARVSLAPSPLTAFGARIAGWEKLELPVFDTARATATLDPQEGNTYDAKNAIDQNLETCWAYPASAADASLTLTATQPQTVRGIVLTPGYAKSAYAFSSNCRAASVAVALGDKVYRFDLADVGKDDYAGTYVLPFGEEVETDEVTVTVEGTYKGTNFGDTCISEITVF